MIIRRERQEDYDSILCLTYHAFLTLDFPGRQRMDEHFLVSLLRGSESVIQELSFVAECEGEIVGHIIYARSEVLHEDGTTTQTITFGPLSVLPNYHKQGIGAALVRHSMERARELGYQAVLIVGVPDYYPKLGFRRAIDYGLVLPDGSAPDAFMAYELVSGSLNQGGEAHFLAPEYEIAENDNAGYDIFHKKFMRENYSGKVMLRPLWDADVDLMEKWLGRSHVARWYEHPEDWMHEIRERRVEFSFIKHFIAEVDGAAIGFCQYYDCYDGRDHEDWYSAEVPGVTYSIDYLIGEPESLKRGYGREMVRLLGEILSDLGAERVIAQPEQDNFASRKALEANGYVWNGDYYVLELNQTRIK